MLPGIIPVFMSLGTPPIGTPANLGSNVNSAGSTTVAFTSGSNIAAGDLVVVVVIAQGASNYASGVSDGTNTYTAAVQVLNAANVTCEIWYKTNAAAVTTPTITATFPVSKTYRIIGAARVTGANGGLDKTASSTTGGSISSGTLTIAKEAVFGAGCGNTANTYSESASFTNVWSYSNPNPASGQGYDVVSSTGSVTYNPTGCSFTTALATFKNG